MKKIIHTSNLQTKILFDSLDNLNKYITEINPSSLFILCDNNTLKYCLPILDNILKYDYISIVIEPEEENKNITTVNYIWNTLLCRNADRKSIIINLGGGVICDIGGFAASCYMRGIDFINIPTTLLAQVDASVGGKTGIDFNKYKNIIGTFSNPLAVYIDTIFLKTLDTRQYLSGYAEMIKHALLAGNSSFNDIIKTEPFNHNNIKNLIYQSVLFKNKIVENDFKENGIRKTLNLGHTIGHAVETLYLDSNNKLLHGEAIAVGLICECFLSNLKFGLPIKIVENVKKYINTYYNLPKIPLSNYDTIIKIMKKDKKNRNSKIKFSILKNIGNCLFDVDISNEDIIKSFEYYNS